MNFLDTFTGLTWAVLGSVGGMVKVTVQLLSVDKLPTRTKIIGLLVANAFVSGFAGFLGAVIVSSLSNSDNMHVVAAGISGYMGVSALDYFTQWFKQKLK